MHFFEIVFFDAVARICIGMDDPRQIIMPINKRNAPQQMACMVERNFTRKRRNGFGPCFFDWFGLLGFSFGRGHLTNPYATASLFALSTNGNKGFRGSFAKMRGKHPNFARDGGGSDLAALA